MAKLLVALCLLVGGANAMGIYGTGRPTAEPTQAEAFVGTPVPVTFECYGVEVTTPSAFLCNGPPPPP